MQEAWRQSNLAQSNFGTAAHNSGGAVQYIEIPHTGGDLAYSINNQNMSGKGLTEEQYKLIEQLHGFAVTLGKA